MVYSINEKNEEQVFERTGIFTQYLPQEDRVNIKKGIYVNGNEALNTLLEDYE